MPHVPPQPAVERPIPLSGHCLERVRAIAEDSVAVHLAHHQHRPVVIVPLTVVDWKATASSWDR